MAMTARERIGNILKRKPVDRIGVHEHFWNDTKAHYVEQGHMRPDELPDEHFDLDIKGISAFNMVADLDFVNEVVEESGELILVRDGNGALLRRHKLHDTTPEHVDFRVRTREDWEAIRHFYTRVDPRRINFEKYRRDLGYARRNDKFAVWKGPHVFELIHPILGHETMLMAMALEPEWIVDMCETISRLLVSLQEILFSREGRPDGVWYYEDMGFKERPFMSPAMYREIIMPSHRYTIDYAHGLGLPVIMHSCGYIEPLLPHMLEAGIDCLQVIEVKAGMDLFKLYRDYGDVLSLMGGIDVRVLYTNDRAQIDRELERKIPAVMGKFGYVLHSDHSIPKTVNYDTLRYYFAKGIELGTYR